MEYEWIRSSRKSVAVQVHADGRVTVRSPYGVSKSYVEQFVNSKREWILKQQKYFEENQSSKSQISEEERKQGIEKAMKIFPLRVKYYAQRMRVAYGRITIREQKTRWGSCSSKGNLNFNWKLVLMPPAILDYVVVHELAHRKEMNHSPAFWSVVEEILPDYKERRKWLRENGKNYEG